MSDFFPAWAIQAGKVLGLATVAATGLWLGLYLAGWPKVALLLGVLGWAVFVRGFWSLFFLPDQEEEFQDVRKLEERFKRLKRFDPDKFIDLRKGIFVGLQEGDLRRPAYVSWSAFRSTHCQVVGPSGTGKGITNTLILAQAIRAGETVVVLDPKPDRYMPGILAAEAQRAGRPFRLVDLRPTAPAQINILSGAQPHELTDLFIAGFDLAERGDMADVYRQDDRKAARLAAALAAKGGHSVASLAIAAGGEQGISTAKKFWDDLQELATLPALNTQAGPDLSDSLLAPGAVLYVIGTSMEGSAMKAQKMLLVRIFQSIINRGHDSPQTTVLLDEFKYCLSPVALNALGLVRDFNCHILLAHQSAGDLRSIKNVDPQAATGAVVDNTTLKLVYRVTDGEFARRLADTTGQIRTWRENISKTKRSAVGPEEGSWVADKDNLLSPGFLTNLPKADSQNPVAVGVLFGAGTAKWISVSPLAASHAKPAITPAEPPKEAPSGGAKHNPEDLF